MKISLNWLKEFIEVPFTPKELDHRLTMLGIEVEKIENAAEKYAKILVGEVREVEKHPNADKLRVTLVTIGAGEPLHIVCGAPNVRVGLKVAVATIGADLGEGFVIKKSKIRGELSEGMLCSERELGLSENHEGIWELPSDFEVGQPLADALGKNDVIFEIGITPNRPDCLSHIGIAREIAAITAYLPKHPALTIPQSTTTSNAKVTILDAELCPRYAGRLIKNVKVAPSPEWLRQRIEVLGLRAINNVVDITNLVLMECGHPLHAFDFSEINEEHIFIRRAEGFAKEFTTLDGKNRALRPEMLLIADKTKPLAIAGVMGGENSEIKPTTISVFLESAYFQPASIRKTSKQLGLSTDASYRFERGTDVENVIYALDRAAALMVELCDGEIAGERIDVYPNPIVPKRFSFRPARANGLLGMSITQERMLEVFAKLKIKVEDHQTDTWRLTSPSYRIDLEREEDATEEIARVIGYDEIPSSNFERSPLPATKEALTRRDFDLIVRTHLLAVGATECVSSPLIAEREAKMFSDAPVIVVNPLNVETNRMRTSVGANLLDIARRNERFGADGQRIFEVGSVFAYAEKSQLIGKIAERGELGILLSGIQEQKSVYNSAPVKADVFLLRGIVEQLIVRVGLGPIELVTASSITSTLPWSKSHETFEASNTVGLRLGGKLVAMVGKISKQLAEAYELRHDAFVALVEYEALFTAAREARSKPRTVTALPKYPAVERDLALVLAHSVTAAAIEREITVVVGSPLLRGVRIFDEFRSQEMKQKGERSLAVRLVLRSDEKTMEDAEVDRVVSGVVTLLSEKFGAKLRT